MEKMVIKSVHYYPSRLLSRKTLILKEKQLLYFDAFSQKSPEVELQGVEPWSKQIRHTLSTCLSDD